MPKQKAWKYCVVGNIVRSRVDENGVLRYGTAAFAGGKKVYLCGKFWDSTWDSISVIGLNRNGRYQVVDTPCCLIENIRCQRTYSPSILKIMNDWEFWHYWWDNTAEDKKATEDFVALWNSQYQEKEQSI